MRDVPGNKMVVKLNGGRIHESARRVSQQRAFGKEGARPADRDFVEPVDNNQQRLVGRLFGCLNERVQRSDDLLAIGREFQRAHEVIAHVEFEARGVEHALHTCSHKRPSSASCHWGQDQGTDLPQELGYIQGKAFTLLVLAHEPGEALDEVLHELWGEAQAHRRCRSVHGQAHAQQHVKVIGFLSDQTHFSIEPHYQEVVAEFLSEPDEFGTLAAADVPGEQALVRLWLPEAVLQVEREALDQAAGGVVGVPIDKEQPDVLRTDGAYGIEGVDHWTPELARCVHGFGLRGVP